MRLLPLLLAVPALGQIQFEDVAPAAGIAFAVENHVTPERHMIETMAGGVAAFDFDNDGLTDIFFTNGAEIPALRKTSPKFHNRLYRNLGNWKFEDVTAKAGVAGDGYSMGAAVADFNNDGHPDLFVAGVNHNILYRNRGDGTFEDVTARSGIHSRLWSVAAGWFDFDRDGHLDLFVVNYAKWSPAFDRFCGDAARKLRVYCHPKYFEGLPNTLYRNRGDGTFEDVTVKAGIAPHIGRGMSVAFADYDKNGFPDAFVTNDNLPNFLFRNRGNGAFEEVALIAGVAFLDHGKPVASMGTDFRDYDNDGHPDIVLTALFGETFPLFRNTGRKAFADASYSSRLGQLTAPHSGWCVAFGDFDNDGWKDLFTANSHVNDQVELFEATTYKAPNTVFANRGDGAFAAAAAGLKSARAHRGCAIADFDNDGRLDAVVSSLGEPAELWRNISPAKNNWIALKLTGARGNRDAIGAAIRIGSQTNLRTSALGYASSSHTAVHFGLGPLTRVPEIEIRWPSGRVQKLADVPANQVLVVKEPESLPARPVRAVPPRSPSASPGTSPSSPSPVPPVPSSGKPASAGNAGSRPRPD
jgi:enediyne biosynthesis protein E4